MQGSPDWTKFKINGIYSDGDILRYIHSQQREFKDDDRVDGNFQLLLVNPNTIRESEWYISDDMVADLASSSKQFPPIVIDRQGSIIDGGHRLAAAKLRGDKNILVFKPTQELQEWKKYRVKGNDESIRDLRINHKFQYGLDPVELWRGPHAGAELRLMLNGKKPAALISTYSELKSFIPYIKQEKFLIKKLPDKIGGWVVTLPEESWRINKIISVLESKSSKSRDIKLGILLGYDKDDINAFVNDRNDHYNSINDAKEISLEL